MKAKQLLQNKYVLYILLFLAITNIVGLLSVNNTTSVAFMIIVGLLTSYFSKNMIIIIGTSLLLTNVFFMYGKRVEGFEENDDDDVKGKKKKGKNKVKNSKTKEAQKDGFGQRNVPSSVPASAPNAEFEEDEEIGSRVDYAATMEQAYDNLQGILGNGGMEKLTTETKGLIDQQKNLMKTLNDMQPMMKMAKDTMSGFNLDSMTKSLQNMGSMIGSLKGK